MKNIRADLMQATPVPWKRLKFSPVLTISGPLAMHDHAGWNGQTLAREKPALGKYLGKDLGVCHSPSTYTEGGS